MFLIRFSINNPLVVNLMLVMIVIAGIMSWNSMPQEMFPVIQRDMVRIVTEFEGASPEDVEKEVTIPIEKEFETDADVDFVRSTSLEGQSTIIIKLKPGTKVEEFVENARTKIDRLREQQLPDDVKKSEITRLATRFPVINVAIYGNVDRARLYSIAEEVRAHIQSNVKGIGSVGVAGKREWEIWVVVNPGQLAARQVSLTDLARVLRENLRDLPGGSIKSSEGEILLRGKGYAPTPEAIRKIVIRTNQGGQLTLGEVARVENRLEEARTLGRFNRKASVNITASKTADASTIEVSRQIKALVKQLQAKFPPNVGIRAFGDMSVYVENRLNTLKSSGLVGLVLLLISLYLFLNFRVAVVTAMGIPVSFLVAVICLHYLGFTINMVSMFAFLIALGMIVDDAIIVNENIYRHMEMGEPPHTAAWNGAKEVFWPVVASTLTTVAAFLPMFAITGVMGAFIMVIPVVVAATLLGSLLEAFVVLPSHAKEMLRLSERKQQAKRQWINWSVWLQRYLRVLRWSVVNRYVVLALTIGVLIITMSYASTRLPFNMFSHVDTGQFFVNVEAPNTFGLEQSEELAKRLEDVIVSSLDEKELDTVLTNVGFSFIDFNRFQVGSRYIQFIVDLKKRKPQGVIEKYISPLVSFNFSKQGERVRSNREIINELRVKLQDVSGVQRLSIKRPAGGPAGSDLEVGISGPDLKVLRYQADSLVSFLRSQKGVYDVRHDSDPGKREYRYTLNERGRQKGLTQKQISDIVRIGYLGLEVVHVTRQEKRVPIRLIFDNKTRIQYQSNNQNSRAQTSLGRLQVSFLNPATNQYEVDTFQNVANIKSDLALPTIYRRDLKRLVTVSAEVNPKVITPIKLSKLIEDHFAKFKQKNPDYRLMFLGEKKNAQESFSGMREALILALVIIYFILATLFRSLLDPLVVMFAIPFAIIGVVIGHSLFGYNLQFLSMIGFIALSGIVVNDSLILVDFAKKQRAKGMSGVEAMVEAGRVRIRPILLTSITTFLGISPLIFFASGQTAFLSPMAVSLGFGLIFATVLILISIPCFYLVADDLRNWTISKFRPNKSGSNDITIGGS